MDESDQIGREQAANIVVGQNVEECKVVLAQQMRHGMTSCEAKLWERLRRSNLEVNFRRQQIIAGFIADFYCHQASLVVEVDGPIHDSEYDAERDRVFAGCNIATLRFINRQVEEQIGVVLYQIRQSVKARSEPTPVLRPDPPETGG